MENIQQKIQKSSKGMLMFLRVLCISLIVGLCVPVIILAYHAINPEVNLATSGNMRFYSALGFELKTTGEVTAEMCTVFVCGVLILLMFINAYKMFNSINKEIAPFNQSNARRLKNIGIELIVYSFVTPIARSGFYRTLAPDIKIHTSFEISFVALALLFFFIARIFEYGAELQRQSDETL